MKLVILKWSGRMKWYKKVCDGLKKKNLRRREAGGADVRGSGASRRRAVRPRARGAREARAPRRRPASIASSSKSWASSPTRNSESVSANTPTSCIIWPGTGSADSTFALYGLYYLIEVQPWSAGINTLLNTSSCACIKFVLVWFCN